MRLCRDPGHNGENLFEPAVLSDNPYCSTWGCEGGSHRRGLDDVQRWLRHPARATRDAMVEARGAVFEAKFLMPWSFPEEGAAQKYMPQLHHKVGHQLVSSVFSVITGARSGWRSSSRQTPYSNAYCLRPRRSSVAASREATQSVCLESKHPHPEARPCARLI